LCEKKNLLPFPGIKSQFLGHPACIPKWKGGEEGKPIKTGVKEREKETRVLGIAA
jgi:hypothetical protein